MLERDVAAAFAYHQNDLVAMSTVGSVAAYVKGRLAPVKPAATRGARSAPKSKSKKKKG